MFKERKTRTKHENYVWCSVNETKNGTLMLSVLGRKGHNGRYTFVFLWQLDFWQAKNGNLTLPQLGGFALGVTIQVEFGLKGWLVEIT